MEAVSDLFVHPRRYDFRVSLKTYLYMLGKNGAYRYLKKRSRRGDADLPDPDAIGGNETDALRYGETVYFNLAGGVPETPEPSRDRYGVKASRSGFRFAAFSFAPPPPF